MAPDLERRTAEIAVFLVRRKQTEVLLLHRVPPLGGFWHVVAGGISNAEAWQDAAERELREETGLELAEALPRGTARFSYALDSGNGEDPRGFVRGATVDVYCLLAEVEDDFTPTLNWEHDDYFWCAAPNAPAVLHWSNIADAFAEMLAAAEPVD